MSSLMVVIELSSNRVHPASLEVLGLARRVGTALGATVYAVAACEHAPGYGDTDIIAVLSSHGADKLVLSAGSIYAGPMRWAGHGAAVYAACQLVRPSMLLVAETQGGREIAGRLASRLGAACLVGASVDIEERDVRLRTGTGNETRGFDGELDFVVVAAVPPGRYEMAGGDEEAEVEMLETQPLERDFVELEGAPTDPFACVTVLGEGAGADHLAVALHATRSGFAPLVIALGAATDGLLSMHGALCVALGENAQAARHAHYALAGNSEVVGAALARAVTVVTSSAATALPPPAPSARR